ncbi:MAG: lipid-A-disaccharide synthase, partial [Verrucomicrobiales bacterium]|nr:lipid-A-disaccharide synthase [Verrucomicrobiales bacterium]
MTRLYIVAGEASGDTHGAGLIRALQAIRPDLEISGLGGARMAALGAGKIEDWAETAGVVGLWEVLKMYGYFKKKLELTCEAILQQRPEGVVLVD